MEKSMDCARFREDMLDVLYGEGGDDAASRFDAHRLSCPDCEDEISGFRQVRRDLQSWRYDAPKARRRYWPGLRGLAAAASIVLAFGGGLALARTEVRYREGELRVRFGTAPETREAADTTTQQLLAQHEAQHRAELASMRAALQQSVSMGAQGGGGDADAILQRVQEMIHASEARQSMMIRAGLSDLSERTAAQRQVDMMQISTSLSQLEAQTASDVGRITEQILKAEKK
jgi:hypothetical protein